MSQPFIEAFFDEPTNTIGYLMSVPATRTAVVVNPVLDVDVGSSAADMRLAECIVALAENRLRPQSLKRWQLSKSEAARMDAVLIGRKNRLDDSEGVALDLSMTAGQVSDYIGMAALVDDLPRLQRLLGDRGYDADGCGGALKAKGIKPCIPGRKSRNKLLKGQELVQASMPL